VPLLIEASYLHLIYPPCTSDYFMLLLPCRSDFVYSFCFPLTFVLLSDQEQAEEESEEPFVAPPGLLIPPDVELVNKL